MNRVPSYQSRPLPADAADAETRLKGHVGHLTPEEASAFDNFRKLAAKEGFYTPAAANQKASHDDGTLVYAVLARLFHIANPSPAGTCELGSSSLRMPSPNSKTQRYGAKTTT